MTEPEAITRDAAVFRAIRAMAGWTQIEMGRRIGITSTLVSQLELGEARTHSRYLDAITEATGLKLGDIDMVRDLARAHQRSREQ